MLDLPVWLIVSVLCIGCVIISILLFFLIKRNGKSDVYINKNGVVVKAASPKNITTKQFINFMKEIVSYVEDSKENYVDDVIGIKNLYFKQSKDFAKSRMLEVQNNIIEEYKTEYIKKYSGKLHTSLTEDGQKRVTDATLLLPTASQISDSN